MIFIVVLHRGEGWCYAQPGGVDLDLSGPVEEGRFSRATVDQPASIAGIALHESRRRCDVREPTIEASGSGMAVDRRLPPPRDLKAGMGLLPPPAPLPAGPLELGFVLPTGSVHHVEHGPAEDVVALGGDLQGGVGVVDVEARDRPEVAAAEVLRVLRAEEVPVPPHPLLDEVVTPPVEDLPHIVEEAGLGGAPTLRRPRAAAAVGPQHGIAGLAVYVAAGIDDRHDHDRSPKDGVVHTSSGGVDPSRRRRLRTFGRESIKRPSGRRWADR
ncbi:MAG: hypothetical protein U0790_00470 [Isosphaeraceae bacterium]